MTLKKGKGTYDGWISQANHKQKHDPIKILLLLLLFVFIIKNTTQRAAPNTSSYKQIKVNASMMMIIS